MGMRVEVTSLENLSESQIKELVIIQVSQSHYDSFTYGNEYVTCFYINIVFYTLFSLHIIFYKHLISKEWRQLDNSTINAFTFE